VIVLSREFFREVGHTVHTVAVIVDGEVVGVSPVETGHGVGAAVHTAWSVMEALGIEWPPYTEPVVDVVRVGRHKDLHAGGRLIEPAKGDRR